MISAKIFSHEHLIGTAQMAPTDTSMGGIAGIFEPEPYYYEIQKHVWEFWSTSKPDYKKWHSLRFNAQLGNGCFMFPQGGYVIYDLKDFKDEKPTIELAGNNRHVLDFFEKESAPGFLIEPWDIITIEQKLAFEDELKKEIGAKTIWDYLNLSDTHLLSDFEFSAAGKFGPNDDVLFELITSKASDFTFAVVHLTWIQKKERNSKYPRTEFYKNFENFVERKMNPDILEWNP